MGLPELKSIRRFGLGRRSLKEQPERRSWRAAESSATTGRQPAALRDPAALRAFTTPNICVQDGRIEFIQPPPARCERIDVPEERHDATTVSNYAGRREMSPLRDGGRRQMSPLRDEGRRQMSPLRDGGRREGAPERDRGRRDAATVREKSHRDFASLRDGDTRAVNSLKDRDIRTVSSPKDRGLRTLASLKDRDLHHTVPNVKDRTRHEVPPLREDVCEMSPLIEDDQEEAEPETGLKAKEQKEEDNQEMRNTCPAPPTERRSPVRSPTPGRKVKDKVAQFEQLVDPGDAPRRDSESSEATSAQGTLEAEIQSLELGLEEECMNFKRWNRLAQRTAGETRGWQNRQLLNMSVDNDRCRDRIFSMQDELRRSEERLRAAELARTEAEEKLAAMDVLIKAHEKERQHWLGQVHQLSGQLERLQAASPSPAETGSPSRADLEVRLRSLEAERVELESRSDHCLDDVANQIVQALSKQKMLQSSLDTLRRRVHQLEHENAVLFSLLGREPVVTSQQPLPTPATSSSGSSDDDQLTAACAKVRRMLEEHYGSSAGHAAAPPSGALRWSQFDGLLSDGAAPAACLLCASHACDSSCRLYQPCGDERTPVRHAAAAAGSCSSVGGRQAADSDVIRRLCEAADSASAAQRSLRQLGSEQCAVPGATSARLGRSPSPLLLSTALTDSQKCATLGVLPLGLPPLPSDFSPPPAGASLSALTSERLPPFSGVRASSCPPHGASPASRDDSRREEGRDEGYSTMSSDVQANVSADSGVSTGSVEAPTDSRPRLEDVREVQEEDGRPVASVASAAVLVTSAEPERPERPVSVSSSDSEDMRCLVEALRQSLRPGRRLHLLAEGTAESDVLYLPLTGPAARHSCLVPARPRPVHRCRSDSRLCVKRWAAEAAARPWPGRAPERSSSTLELGAASTLDTRGTASLKRAAGRASLERGGSPPESPSFVPAALPWRDDSSELWRNCFSLEAREMEDWSLHLSAEELRSEPTDDAAGSERLADSSDYSRVGSFPNIPEAILELEEDASECLWNNASYMHQRPTGLPAWPYEHPPDADPPALPSPGADLRISWSSCEQISLADFRDAVLDFNDKNDLKSAECESRLEAQVREDQKRHSNGSDAMSCASIASEDERPENLETEFTRDFYRLVKYESSKSLALSEASAKGDDEPLVSSADRELALASMLNFISEQQRYMTERETEDAAQAREPATDSDSTSCATMDQSTSSATSAATIVTAPATMERPCDERDALDSTIQLAMLAQRCGERSPAPQPRPCVSSPPALSTPSAPTTPACETVPPVPSMPAATVSPVAAAAPEVIVYRAEISTNHKEYIPSAEPAQKRVEPERRCRGGAGVRESPKTVTPPTSTPASAPVPAPAHASASTPAPAPAPVSASTPAPANASKATKEGRSDIPRSPLIGKRKRSVTNNIPRVRPPSSPKLTPRLKKDTVRPMPEPVEPPPAPAAPAAKAVKPSFPSPKLLRRLHPGSSKIASRSSSESAISRGARRVEPAPAPRPDSPQRRATAPPAPARAAARPGSRIPRLRGSRSTDSREAVGESREARELQRTVSEPAEIPDSRRSPLIVAEGDVTSFHRRATSRQLIDELKRLSALEAREAPPPTPPEPHALREGCDTGWVRVDRHLDLHDSQVRSELYDVMLATRGSSDSSSSDSESDATPQSASEYQHLKLVHQQRRRKQVSRRKDGALRYTPVFRPPIINRPEFFFRYGPQERAALATFDFLERLPSASSGDVTASRR